MADVVIDINAVIWHFGDPAQLSAPAAAALARAEAGGTVYVSAITLVELIYLTEKGRIPPDVPVLLRDSVDDTTTAFLLIEMNREISDAVENVSRAIVSDMPDRIIAATALHLDLPLITKDRKIRALPNVQTIW